MGSIAGVGRRSEDTGAHLTLSNIGDNISPVAAQQAFSSDRRPRGPGLDVATDVCELRRSLRLFAGGSHDSGGHAADTARLR